MSLSGCVGVASGLQPISGFDLQRYLGKWYEIARLDHSFERGLANVTAEYSVRANGGVKVVNRGYSQRKKAWKVAEGKAFFVHTEREGHLKVSFFGPFYGSYVIFELDKKHYEYAFVTSYNKRFLWLLARTPQVEQALIDRFLEQVKNYGFNTDNLIFVDQTNE